MHAVRQRWWRGLARLEGQGHGGGDYVVERQGFEDPMCGVKRVSVTLVRNEMKKKLIFTCVPTNAGNGGGGTCED